MWNRFLGESNDSKDDSPLQSSWCDDDEQRHLTHPSTSIASSTLKTKASPVDDVRGSRGFHRSSTSSSATFQGQNPGATSAPSALENESVPRNKYGETYMAPSLVSDAGHGNQMPRSGTSRSSRDQDQSREIRDKKRGKAERSDGRDQDTERRRKKEKRDDKDKDLRRSSRGLDEEFGTSRGPGDFPDQVASSGFSQFPGQYDGAIPGSNGSAHGHPAMSSHVQDQFPGQFPTQSSAPYRPPLAASEGGPGLAAEYYGDAGQSVAEQPGNRANTPSLIIGAEPHLQPALAVAAPPPEPSASGAVGAAASFFSGEFEEYEVASTHGQQTPSTYVTNQTSPYNNQPSSSVPVIPTVGASMMGSATGYLIGSQASSHQQRPNHEPSSGGAPNDYSSIATHRPPSEMQDSYYFSTSQPTKPGKQSSQSFSNAMYAAGVAGAAGSAAATYEHNHHTSTQESSFTSQYPTTSMAQRRRSQGPLSSLINFFKDPEGVAQFEEYSQIVGVCRHCFAPGSSPRDAPRKHFYGRRRSNERYGSNTRVDKDNRYHSSENEGSRKNKSWLTTGLAGYGLAKIGENLFKGNDDPDNIYSVKVKRFSPDGRDRPARRGSRSKEPVETGITDNGNSVRKEQRDNVFNDTTMTAYRTKRPSRTRSRSTDRKISSNEATAGAVLGNFSIASSSRRQSHSPRGTPSKNKQTSQAPSPERRHATKKKKRDKGFFSFGNGSSSSSSVDSAYSASHKKHRNNRNSTSKSKDGKKAEAALLGLGAAAAALALNDGRQVHKKKGIKELVGVKESRFHDGHDSAQARKSKKMSPNQDEELWESAAEDDYESMDSDLAYGASVRRDSRVSLSSESSGTSKWSWRWGSKNKRRLSPPRGKSSEYASFPSRTSAEGADVGGPASTSLDQRQGSAVTSSSSLPLQHVYPVPTSDPSRFDVGPEEQVSFTNRRAMSTRPETVPLQHPRPIAPISAAIYSSQTANNHSNSAPAGTATFSQNLYHHNSGKSDARHNSNEASKTNSLPHFEQQANDVVHDFKLRRRETSPARYGADSISSSMASQPRISMRNDSSTVRFDLTEEQEERDRQERRRNRKLDKERRDAEDLQKTEKNNRFSTEESIEKRGSKPNPEKGHAISGKSWVGPAAAGVIGAAIGSAAATERSGSEETREQRRERRRREREIEDEEDAFKKSQRRRRQREHDDQVAATQNHGRLPDEMSAASEYTNYQGRSQRRQDMSVWQEAASTKRSSSHENYGAFFTPLELLSKSSDQVKITSANADADVDVEQVPNIVTVEPKRIHDLSDSPTFLLADTDSKVDPSKPSFPWQVPKLRLVEPTPPSTRGSTPILRAEDGSDKGVEEPWKDRSASKDKWSDDQTHEYTIITPKEDSDEIIETRSVEISSTDLADSSQQTPDRDSSDDRLPSANQSRTENSPASYGEDIEFAATLAASAEDAGFDPSIVFDNPKYRRRDSPPGSDESSMPGGFDDGKKPRFGKKERKSSHQSPKNGANARDNNDAIVQDIISQVQEAESQPPHPFSSEIFDDEGRSKKEIERAKAEKGRKGLESGDKLFKTSETAREVLRSQKGDVYDSSIEDDPSIAPINNETESDGMSRKESKGVVTGLEKAVSAVPRASTTELSRDSTSKPNTKRKGSIWNQVLGKSAKNSPQEIGPKDVAEGTVMENLDKIEKTSEKHKERESDRDRDDDHDGQEGNTIEGTTTQYRDGNLNDLPVEIQEFNTPSRFSDAGSVAKYLDHVMELEQVEEKLPESFLELRPEPPPPPDKRAENEVNSTPLETTSIPASSDAESKTQSRRFSDAGISGPAQGIAVLPSSPTAVPLHFRRPGHSSSTARSLSQISIDSQEPAPDPSPKQKTRPRSTEFKSSTEIRPLWLVERHRSYQEPTHESYPSLPSSHTTSRSSSVHDPEERENPQMGDDGVDEIELKPVEAESASTDSTNGHLIQSDLLDSQHANLIVSSVQDTRYARDLASPQASGVLTPIETIEENTQRPPSAMNSVALGAINGDSAAVALTNDGPFQQNLSGEKNHFARGHDDMVLDTMTQRAAIDTLDQDDELFPHKIKKNKKNKRKANQTRHEILQASDTAGVNQSEKADGPEPLSLESMQQIQEQDANDAVDSWSPSVRPSTRGKKAKKGKGKAPAERSLEASEPPPSLDELPRDTSETAMSAEGQENQVLSREMSRRQIVDIMAATAQEADEEEKEGSQSGILTEENRSEPKSEKDNKGQKTLAEDDSPQDGLQKILPPLDCLPLDDFHTSRFLPGVISQDSLPRDDPKHSNSTQNESTKEVLPRDDAPQDKIEHTEIQHVETQLKSHSESDISLINLPRNDPSQLQELQDGPLQRNQRSDSLPSSGPLTITFEGPFPQDHASVLKSLGVNPASLDSNRGEMTTEIYPQLDFSPRETPLRDSDDDLDLLDDTPRTPIATSLVHSDEIEQETTAERFLARPHTQDLSANASGPQGQSQNIQSQAERVDAGSYAAVPSVNNLNNAKRSFSTEDNEITRFQTRDGLVSTVVTSTKLEEARPKGLNVEAGIDVPITKSEAVEDELAASTSRESGKTEKNAEERFSAETNETTEFQEGQRSPLHTAAPDELEDHEATNWTVEPVLDVSKPKTEPLKDERAGSDNKKTSEEIEKPESQVMYPGLGSDETERQVELQPDGKDDIKGLSSPSVSIHTSQEVSAKLGVGELEASVAGESKDAFPSDSRKGYDLQKSSENLLSDGNDQNLLISDEPQTAQIKDGIGNARNDTQSPALETSVAGTDGAQAVQDTLAVENDAEVVTDLQSQAKDVSKGVEAINDTLINDDELDLDTSKKQKKNKKRKKNEATSRDRLETIDPTEVSGPRAAKDTQVVQDITVDEKKDEVDLDAPKKKKKGKKGKKNENSSLYEPEIISSPPSALESPLMEQEPAASANDERFGKQSRRDKGKKGKRRGFLNAISGFRDEDESNVVPVETPQVEDKAKDPTVRAGDSRKDIDPSVAVVDVTQDDSETDDLPASKSRNHQEPTVVPIEILHSDDQSEDRRAVNRPSVTSNMRKEVEPNTIPTEAAPDNGNMESRATDQMPPDRVEGNVPQDMSERAISIESDRDDGPGESREAPLKEEQQVTILKGKKDKRKSKKSKRSSGFSLDDGNTGDGQSTGTRAFGKTQVQTIASSVDVGEESTKTVPEILNQGEEFTLPTKKNKKKSKKFSAFPLDGDVLPTPEDEPISTDLEKELPKQTCSSSVDATENAGKLVEDLPERKNDREREGEPSELESKDGSEQFQADTARELNKDPETPNPINTLNVFEDSGMVGDKHEEAVGDEFKSLSVHAATRETSCEPISPVTPSPEKQAGAYEETKANRADEFQGNVNRAGATNMDTVTNLKPITEDQKVATKAQQLTQEEDEVSREPKAVPVEIDTSENVGEWSTVPLTQHSESWLKPAMPILNTESAGIVQPEIKSDEDENYQGNEAEEIPSQERQDIQPMIGTDHEDSSTNVEIEKPGGTINKEELPAPEPEDHLCLADTGPIHRNDSTSGKQPRDDMSPAKTVLSDDKETSVTPEREEYTILTEPKAIDQAKDEDLSKMPLQVAENYEMVHDDARLHQPGVEESSAFIDPEPAQEATKTFPNMNPVKYVEPVEGLNAQEQCDYGKEFERAISDTEPEADFKLLRDSVRAKPIPAVEVEMLDAQEQREYDEEYAKELERQLSPLQKGEQVDSLNESSTSTPVFPPLNIDSKMERPYEEGHKPLARPPALEDIIEEPRSRPSSVQGTHAERGDEASPTKSTTKGKKGRKGKKGKRQQPIIWEDETATPPLKQEDDQETDLKAISPEGSALRNNDATLPLDLEEQVEEQSFEDRTIPSPNRELNTAYTSGFARDRSDDYFAIQPSKSTEEYADREGTRESRQAVATELLDVSKDQYPTRELQPDQDDNPRDMAIKTHTQDDKPAYLATEPHPDPRTQAKSARNKVHDESDHAFVGDIKHEDIEKGAKMVQRSSVWESNPEALRQESGMDLSPELKPQIVGTLNEVSPSLQQALHSPLYENEPFSLAEARLPNPGESRGTEEVSTAVVQRSGTLAAESGGDINKGDGGRKATKAGSWTNFEAETGERGNSPDTLDQGIMAASEEVPRASESEDVKGALQHHQATPPPSPSSASHGAVEDHSAVENLSRTSETPTYRDSAVYVSGSPMISEETPFHRAARDSGYPDTETSPTVHGEIENPDASTESKRRVAADERAEHVQRRSSSDHETYEPQISSLGNPLEVSIETNSDFDVSISRPKEKRKRSRRNSAVHDSDDSADSGFDIQRRRRRQAMAAEPREPSPVSSTTKDRSSALFDSSPSAREEVGVKSQDQNMSPHYGSIREEPTWSFDREDSSLQQSEVGLREDRSDNIPKGNLESTGYSLPASHREALEMSLFGGPRTIEDDVLSPSRSPRSSESRGRRRLNTISEDSVDGSRPHGKDKRVMSDVGSPGSGIKGRRMRSPTIEENLAGEYGSAYDLIPSSASPAADEGQRAKDERSRSRNSDHLSALSSHHETRPSVASGQQEGEYRTGSAASMQSEKSIHAIIQTPEQVRSASGLSYYSSRTPPLRHAHRSASGDLRGASKKDEAKSRAKSNSGIDDQLNIGIPSSSTYDPVTDKGKTRADMADIYEGWGDVRGQSPMSPTRPPSMRRRQSMQLLDLETRLDQIVSENRLLASQKLTAEKALQEQASDHSQERHAYEEAMREHKTYLAQKDSEVSSLRKIIDQLHDQVAQMAKVNDGLASSPSVIKEHEERYSQLQAEHAHTHEQWQQSARELEDLKEQQHTLVRHEVTVALDEKNLELRQLQNELENAKLQVRNLQQQLLASRNNDDFVERDEDYFDSRCQSLCQHVQQWVLRFSKFSDMKACYLAREIKDEKIVDRMENAILDGSDVDDYLSDRVKRRDVFMSVIMTMIWEFIFTRYLFGMDREQRQKLKNLEKTLQGVGPMSAVHKWRATTLTLLMKREAFEDQRATDTEAVLREIYDTLATFLPPPSHLVSQIQESLRKVIDEAVDLSIEMRTQRAEYSMLPPLQPEYDTNGDLARKVYFSALTMNERSGTTSSNDALQEQQAVVRMVLFPLVVKNEDDDEQIVVCPAQVLTAESKGKKTVRVLSAQGGRSEASFAGSDVRMEGGMI